MKEIPLGQPRRWRIYGARVAQLAGGRALATLVQAGTLIWLARLVGPEPFGALALALAASGYAVVLGDYGLGTLVLRTRAQNDPDYLQEIMSVSAKLLALVSVVLTIGLTIWVSRNGLTLWLAAIGLAAGLEKLLDNTLMIPVADGRTQVVALSLIGRRVLNFLGVMTAYLLGESVVAGYCIGYLAASIVAFAANYLEIVAAGGLRRHSHTHGVLRAGLPFFISSASAQLRTLDAVLVGLYSGVAAAGGYSAAARLMSPVMLLTNSLSPVVMPETTRRARGFSLKAAGAIAWLGVAISAALVPSFFVGDYVMAFVFGPAYSSMGSTLAVLLIAAPWVAGAALLEAIAQSQGHERTAAAVSFVMGLVQVLAMALGAMLFGALGLAWAILFVSLARAVLMYIVIAWGVSKMS